MSPSDTEVERDKPPVRILVADDEPLIVKAITLYFTAKGYEVDSALDAPGALTLLDSKRYDCAFVDLNMPGDGLTVVDAIREDPDFDGRIVLMSGAVASDPRWETGPGLVRLSKPFRLADLATLVEGGFQH